MGREYTEPSPFLASDFNELTLLDLRRPGATLGVSLMLRLDRRLHQIGKVRLRIPTCLDEIQETGLARLKLDVGQPATKEFIA